LFESPPHRESFRDRREFFAEIRYRQLEIHQIPFHARQKQPHLRILMLVGVQNVRVMAKQKIRNRRHNPFAIRTVD